MNLLMDIGVEAAPHFPVSFTLVYIVALSPL